MHMESGHSNLFEPDVMQQMLTLSSSWLILQFDVATDGATEAECLDGWLDELGGVVEPDPDPAPERGEPELSTAA